MVACRVTRVRCAADRDLQKLHEKFWKRVAKDFHVAEVGADRISRTARLCGPCVFRSPQIVLLHYSASAPHLARDVP
jgi:hypothetical protein